MSVAARVRRAWVPGLIGWILGTGAQTLQPALWPGAAYAALAGAAVLLATLVLRWRGHPRVAVWGWLPIAAALAFALTGWRALGLLQQRLPDAWDGAEVEAVWQVTGLPRYGPDGVVFGARLLQARALDGVPLSLAGTVRIGFWRAAHGADGEPVRVRPGEVWRSHLRLRAPRGLANPHGFDAEAWLWREGVAATARVLEGARRPPPGRVADDAWAFPVERARAAVRDAIVARVEPRAGTAAAGLVAALVTGDQAAIPDADWRAIRATGVAHLVAISGLHVTMFAWLAVAVVGRVWRGLGRRWPRLLLACPVPLAAGAGGVALAGAYALFAGGGVPAQRTVTMLAVVVGLALTGRRWPWPVTWGLAMAAALLIDPWAWWQPGFWLSFAAVAVLFAQGDGGLPGVGWTGRLRHALREGGRAQLVVTVALAPLTLVFFGQVSVVGLLANAVAIPWVTWLLTPVALLGVLAAPLWDVAAALARGLLTMLHALAAWPLAVWERPALPVALALLACAGGLLLVAPLPWRWRAWGAILLWPAWTFQPPVPAPGTFEVLLPDVGQGSAAIVRTARHTLVFDAGPPLGRGDAAERVLLPWLRALGARPDAIVISHDDSDHAAGVATLAGAYPHAAWWASFDPGERVAAPVRSCVAGEAWEWDGVRFAFLHPPTADWVPSGRGGDNARSCVLRIGDGTASALLTGDIRREEEALLIAAGAAQPVGLLVAAHHGSGTSTSAAWLDALRPQAVAIQAGWRNRYGHPHPQVVRRLDERGIAWVNTATCGAATWHSVQPGGMRCERRERRRYVDTGAPLATGAAIGAVSGAVDGSADGEAP